MGPPNYLEPYLVALFPLWSAGVGMEKFDILEKTADEKSKYKRGDGTINEQFFIIYYIRKIFT